MGAEGVGTAADDAQVLPLRLVPGPGPVEVPRAYAPARESP